MGGQQGWHGERERDQERARRIADALHKLTGRRPLVEHDRNGGATKVSLKVVERPDRTQTLAVLRVLRHGDRFGHARTARWEHVWVEVGARRGAGSAPVSPPTG
ncbi:hypothetical protein [Kitasatospora griseola]|uniref:hypothetical protein n=1 Tax=Kitasatospora griseola TaxID=2064 RepID=UPI001670D030|nr:hypothetical protein [Kitasatospora griseola]GGQ98432.1 hypothetical protein GCM10010195_62840 [Kitasatospora griseola]